MFFLMFLLIILSNKIVILILGFFVVFYGQDDRVALSLYFYDCQATFINFLIFRIAVVALINLTMLFLVRKHVQNID